MSGWRETLERKWPYMVTATLLSVFLWIAVSADTVSQQTIAAELLIVNNDRGYVMTESEPETDVVSVVFTGRAGDLIGLSMQRPQIFISIDSVESLELEQELTPEMVLGRGGRELVDVRAVSVRPERLTLRFQPREQKIVPVVPVLDIAPAVGFMLSDSVRVEPGAVSVEGPADAVAQIDSILTLPIVRDELREPIAFEAPLEQPTVSELVTPSVSSVRISISVEQRGERIFPGVPLNVIGVSEGEYRLEPSLVDITLSGPRSAVASVRPEGLTPRIELYSSTDLGKLLPVRLDILNRFILVVIDPDSARVVMTGDATQ